MKNVEQFKSGELNYWRELPAENKFLADFIELLHKEYPGCDFLFDKFVKNKPETERVKFDLAEFIQIIRQLKNPPLKSSIKNEIVRSWKSKSQKDEEVLEFSASGFVINGEEHIIWANIPDNEENRKKIEQLIKKAEIKK